MKIALIVTDPISAYHFRRNILLHLVSLKQEVYLLTSFSDMASINKIELIGVECIEVDVDRFMNPIGDIRYFFRIYSIIKKRRFDVVHNFSIKPNIYGTIAAKLARTELIITTITGLGYLFTETEHRKKSIKKEMAILLYRISMLLCNRVWFQNEDDFKYFQDKNLLRNSKKAAVIRGSGVNMEDYDLDTIGEASIKLVRSQLLGDKYKIIVVMVGRLLWTKGVKEYLEAIERVNETTKDILFLLIGDNEKDNPENVPHEYIKTYEKNHESFVSLGHRDDVEKIVAASDIVVLPSYREGSPRSLIEALGLSKPIITTNVPGCRQIVKEKYNGILVNKRDSKMLANAIIRLANDNNLRSTYGRNSRLLALKEYDDKIVLKRMVNELYIGLKRRHSNNKI